MTITEALAEIKTIEKRILTKKNFIAQNAFRMDGLRDPFEKDGGSVKLLEQEQQSLNDLQKRIIELRKLIRKANEDTVVAIQGDERSIADWLVWKREVAPLQRECLSSLSRQLTTARDNARRSGTQLVSPGSVAERPTDIIVNVNEKELAKSLEKLETILGELDGQLSLKNATVQL